MNKLFKIKENNEVNIINHIYDYKTPTYIYIPVENEQYELNTCIYKNSYINNTLSSISGKIEGYTKVKCLNKLVNALKVKNDFKENINQKYKIVKVSSKEELIKLLNVFGLNTLLTKFTKENIKNLVISSIDEESYSAKEFIRLTHNYQEILDAIDYLTKILDLDLSFLAVKNTNFNSIKNVKAIIGMYPNIRINLVPDRYFIGYEKHLCDHLNIDLKNSIILTTNEIFDIYNILFKGKGKTETLVTISGNAISKSLIINTKTGVLVTDVIKEYVEIIDNDYDIFLNGLIKGIKVDNINNLIITNSVESIVINKKDKRKITECINCGACIKVCPVNINVKNCLEKNISSKKCIKCGLCNYICPANINLKKVMMSDEYEK